MPVNSTRRTMWEDQVKAAYLLDPDTGLPIDPSDVKLSASELHIGEVGTADTLIEVIPTLDTNIYASGDVFFVSIEVPNAVRVAGGKAILQSIFLQDKALQSAAFDLLFCRTAIGLGANLNAPEAISDASGQEIIGKVSFVATDYTAFVNFSVATKNQADIGMGMVLKPTVGTSIWICGVCRGTPTYAAAASLIFKLGLLRA